MGLLTPGELELSYLRKERKLIGWFSARFFRSCLFFTAVLFTFSFFSQGLLNSGADYLVVNGFKNFYIFLFFLPIAIGLTLGSVFMPKKLNLGFLVFSSCIVWVMLQLFLFHSWSDIFLHRDIALFVPYLLAGGAFYLYFSKNERLKYLKLGLFAAFFWSGYSYIFINRHAFQTEVLGYFWELKLPFLWIFISTIPFYFPKKENSWHLLFNPAHITRGTIWPSGSEWNLEYEEKKILWIHGALNIILALAMLNLKMQMENSLNLGSFSFFSRVSLIQFMRILTDIGICNLLTGMARMFGYRVSDATSFVLLARTPADYWRRGSVYTYQFVLRTLYLPIVRLTKNRFFAVFVAFLFFYSNRLGFERFFGSLMNFTIDDNIQIDSFVFVAYYLNIIITHKYWFIPKTKMNHTIYSWLSVFLTHFMNILLVGAVRLLVKTL